MEIIISSKYVKPGENIQHGDIVKIKDEGKYNPGKYGPQLEFKLEMEDGSVKTYTPNTQTQINLKQEFGSDSKNWVDQPLKAWVFEQVKGGEMKMQLILTPQDWDKPVMEKATSSNSQNDDGQLPDVKKIPF